jgi:hypothetical protein
MQDYPQIVELYVILTGINTEGLAPVIEHLVSEDFSTQETPKINETLEIEGFLRKLVPFSVNLLRAQPRKKQSPNLDRIKESLAMSFAAWSGES